MKKGTNPVDETDSCDRILPLLSESGDKRLVTEWIETHPAYEAVDLTGSIEDTSFDVCILDTGAFQKHLSALRTKKSAASPVVLPYLLLLDESDSDIIDIDDGDLVENVVTESIDEIVTMPIQQAELHWRLAALLRLREQSLTLRQRERDLERQVNLFRRSQDIANVGAWEYDLQTDNIIWTKEVYQMHDLSEGGELTPEAAIEYYHPEDRDTIREAFRGAVEESESYDVELRLITAEGDQRWVRTRGEPQQEDGEVVRVRGTIQDITDRKKSEQELTQNRELLDRTQRIADVGGWEIDIDTMDVYWSDRLFEILGVEYDEDPSLDEALSVYHEKDRSVVRNAVETALNTGEPFDIDVRFRRPDGEVRWLQVQGVPTIEAGEVVTLRGAVRDITERKERERELERKDRAIDAAPVGIAITNPDQEDNPMMYVNDAFVEMTEYPREETLGENCRFLQGESTDPKRVAQIREAIDNEEPIALELRNYRKNGTEFWNRLEIAPVRDDEGEVINWVGFQQDVTERRQHNQQLETIDRVLRHNLRNRINVIRGHAELIHSKTSGEVAQSAANIVGTSDGLMELAEKERAITKVLLEEPVRQEVALTPVLRDIVSTVECNYPEATVRLECPEDVTVSATGRLKKALIELVENGIIHDDSDSPEVGITVTRSNGTTQINIADTGPQIPEAEQNIFEENAERTPVYHGSGLGLWLVKLIITRSGGTITVSEDTPTGNIVRILFQQ